MTRVLGVLHRLCCRDEPGGSDAVTTPSGFSDQFRRILQLKKDDDLEQWRERRDDRGLYSVHGTPRLRRSVVTYLDTLGTKARSANLSDADLRGDIEDNDEYQKRLHSRFWNGATQRMVTFSDNVCVAAPIDGQDVEALIRDQVDAAASFQIARVLGGRAIRGGITIGEVYCDSNYVDGPALVEAVSLEEKVAKDPRVLIDGHAAAEIRNRWAGHAEPWPYRLVAVDDDDRLFLNYLHASGPFVASLSDPTDPMEKRVASHRSVVVSELAKDHPTKVRSKWQWVARYHNWFVEEFFPSRADLRVPRYKAQGCSLLLSTAGSTGAARRLPTLQHADVLTSPLLPP